MLWQELDTTAQAIFLNLQELFDACILHTKPDESYYFTKNQNDVYFSSQIPFPLMNGIFSDTSDASTIDTKCQDLLHRFKESDCPITWYWPHDETIPPEVMSVFDKHGFQSMGQYLSIAMECEKIKSTPRTLKKNAVIRRVAHENDFSDFLQITQDVYGMPEHALHKMSRLYSAYQYTPKVRLYLAYVDNKPASTLLCYEDNHVVGLYNGATLEPYRKQGLLTNLAIHAVKETLPTTTHAVSQLMASQNAKGICDQFEAKSYAHFTPLCSGFNLNEMKA